MASTSSSPPYRLPLPENESVAPENALRRARVREFAVVEVPPSEISSGEILLDADAILWRPTKDALERMSGPTDEPWDFEPWRDLVGGRKLLVDVAADREHEMVQALLEAGFVIQQRELLDTEPARAWLVAKTDSYRVRTCRQDDEETILDLFAPLFHSGRSAEQWRWKYIENPWGRRWISLAVSADGALAAHYAGYPVPFVRWPADPAADSAADSAESRREDLVAVQIGDTMTAPEHRKVGLGWTSLLGRAVRHHFARFGRVGVAFYYGFNTGKIRNFNLRFIQGRWAGSVGFYRRPASMSPTTESSASATSRRLRRLEAHRIEFFGEEFDQFLGRVGRHYQLLVRRDAAWLRWRYATCPDEPPFFAVVLRSKGRVVGWSVFRSHHDAATNRRQLRWVDALFDPDHAESAGALLGLALAQPEAAGAQEVTAWFSPRPAWWLDVLEHLGFERIAEPDDLGLIYLPFDDPETDDYFQDLYYSWGDSDLT